MPNLPSLNVIYDISVKQFDFVDRALDSHTSRAATMIGWTSLVSTGALLIQDRLSAFPVWRWIFIVPVLLLAAVALLSSLRAYLMKDVEPWPSARWFVENYAHEAESETRLQLMGNIEDSIRKNTHLAYEKSKHVKRAIMSLVWLTGWMLASLLGSYVLQLFGNPR